MGSSSNADAAPTSPGLPAAIRKRAMDRQLELHQERIETMYNRHRALFAESLIAELLPGADESPDPSAAWDVTWSPDRKPIRIQVKCSGGYLPRNVDPNRVAPAQWEIKVPNRGWDPDGEKGQLWNLGAGHHCHVFVLARHEGKMLDRGWTFAAVPTALIANSTTKQGTPRTMFSARQVEDLGSSFVSHDQLEQAVRRASTEG